MLTKGEDLTRPKQTKRSGYLTFYSTLPFCGKECNTINDAKQPGQWSPGRVKHLEKKQCMKHVKKE